MPFLISILAGVFILLGAALTKLYKDSHIIEAISFALALGALVSLMIFDLVPDMFEGGAKWYLILIFVAIGFGILYLLDLLAPDHDEHHDTPDNHDNENSAHIGIMSAIAVILHNIIEGMTVYTMTMADLSQGLILAISIGLHNIPMGMLIYSTLSHKRRKAKLALLTAVIISTPIGGVLMMLMSGLLNEMIIGSLVSVASGMILYLIFMELLPHVLKTKPRKYSLIGVIVGFIVVLLSTFIG